MFWRFLCYTQMQAAKSGVVTDEMRAVAAMEHRDENEIRDLVAREQVVICANKLHTCLKPCGVGSMLSTKINVNLGVSKDCKDYDAEMQKVTAAVEPGAHAIMDLSSQTHRRMPRHGRHGADIRQRNPLPPRPRHLHGARFSRRGSPARGGSLGDACRPGCLADAGDVCQIEE